MPYWNKTFYILIHNNTGLVYKYAELDNVTINKEDFVKASQLIGRFGLVLNSDKITGNSPLYIKRIKKNRNESMLHFELYTLHPAERDNYLGGN